MISECFGDVSCSIFNVDIKSYKKGYSYNGNIDYDCNDSNDSHLLQNPNLFLEDEEKIN